ncbi:hypothetical protein OG558_23890 [Kribbella sp. NBC_01510]|uniref:hypothetical protein n=1 Tax=Kribbella sp. NBC_01510 TaxID=2903581 RepID=UPI00386F89B8
MAREEWAAVQDRLTASYDEVRDELLGSPGVIEIGVGLRRRDGRVEDEAVYVVSVRKKLPSADVAAGELTPESIHGVPTDVEEYSEPVLLLGFDDEDDQRNYETKGGAGASAEHRARGTLGCFCRRKIWESPPCMSTILPATGRSCGMSDASSATVSENRDSGRMRRPYASRWLAGSSATSTLSLTNPTAKAMYSTATTDGATRCARTIQQLSAVPRARWLGEHVGTVPLALS